MYLTVFLQFYHYTNGYKPMKRFSQQGKRTMHEVDSKNYTFFIDTCQEKGNLQTPLLSVHQNDLNLPRMVTLFSREMIGLSWSCTGQGFFPQCYLLRLLSCRQSLLFPLFSRLTCSSRPSLKDQCKHPLSTRLSSIYSFQSRHYSGRQSITPL